MKISEKNNMMWNSFIFVFLIGTSTLLYTPTASSTVIGEDRKNRHILTISSDTPYESIRKAASSSPTISTKPISSTKYTDSPTASPQPSSGLLVYSYSPTVSGEPSSYSKRTISDVSSELSGTPTASPTISYEPNDGLQGYFGVKTDTTAMPTITTVPQKPITADKELVSLLDNTDAPSISSKPSNIKILSTSQPSTSPEPSGSMILITVSPSISPAPISYSKVTGNSNNPTNHGTVTPTVWPTRSSKPYSTLPPPKAQIKTDPTTLPTKSSTPVTRPTTTELVHDFTSSQPIRKGSGELLKPTSALINTNAPSISSNPSGILLLNTALPTISPKPSTDLPTISPKPSTALPTISPKPSTVVQVTSIPTLSPTTSNVPLILETTGSSDSTFPTPKAHLESESTTWPTTSPTIDNIESYNGLEAQDGVNRDKETTTNSNSSARQTTLGNTKLLLTFIVAVAALIIIFSTVAVWRKWKGSQGGESYVVFDAATTGRNLKSKNDKNINISKAYNNNNNSSSSPAEEQEIAIHPDISNQMFQFNIQISEDKSVDGTDCWSHQANDLPSPYFSQRPT